MSGKKCKYSAPNGQEYDCKPSKICEDCEYNTSWTGGVEMNDSELEKAYKAGKTLQYQKENGEWVDFSKNTVCDDFKFQEHLNYRIKPKSFSDTKSDGLYIRTHDYTKILNYIEAIRLIAEKVRTAESDCIEQLARDVGNYLYDLVKRDKDNG